jgi:hypothetical protein
MLMRGLPDRQQHTQLPHLLARRRSAPAELMPATRDLAGPRAWLREHTVAGMEGVKRIASADAAATAGEVQGSAPQPPRAPSWTV